MPEPSARDIKTVPALPPNPAVPTLLGWPPIFLPWAPLFPNPWCSSAIKNALPRYALLCFCNFYLSRVSIIGAQLTSPRCRRAKVSVSNKQKWKHCFQTSTFLDTLVTMRDIFIVPAGFRKVYWSPQPETESTLPPYKEPWESLIHQMTLSVGLLTSRYSFHRTISKILAQARNDCFRSTSWCRLYSFRSSPNLKRTLTAWILESTWPPEVQLSTIEIPLFIFTYKCK